MTPAGFPHSDTPGSTLGCQLPRAYRRLLRPSSALDAKASTMCPSQLVTHTTTPTPPTPTHVRRTTRRRPVEPDWRCTHQATKEPHTHPTITPQTQMTPAAGVHTYKQATTPTPPNPLHTSEDMHQRTRQAEAATTPHPNQTHPPGMQLEPGRGTEAPHRSPRHHHEPHTNREA